MWNFIEMRRNVIANVDWLLTIAAPKLSDVRYRSIVQSPKSVLIEGFYAFDQTDLHTIGQQIILPQQILLLDGLIQLRMFFFADGHERIRGPFGTDHEKVMLTA